ncbi:MAG: hypothetical protein U0R64_10120 [Candidatus Nanopelagicales bacterium]
MDEDELAKLMREIDAMDGKSPAPASPAPTPVPATPGNEVATQPAGGRKGRWVAMAAIGGGIGGFVVGSVLWFVPYVNGVSTGLGAALGGALVALVGRPPRRLE